MAPTVAAILNDVTGPLAARQLIICISSCKAHDGLSTTDEIFSKCCNITKTQGGGGPSTPLLVPRWGVTLLVRPQVINNLWKEKETACYQAFSKDVRWLSKARPITDLIPDS